MCMISCTIMPAIVATFHRVNRLMQQGVAHKLKRLMLTCKENRLLAKLILQEIKAPKVRGHSAEENPVLT